MGQADWNLPYEKLDCPVLVVTGPHDRIFYDKEVIEELSARIPKVQKVEIPGMQPICFRRNAELNFRMCSWILQNP